MMIKRLLRLQVCLLLLLAPNLQADQARFDTIQVGATVYRDVRVREVNPKWLVILHADGISQVPLAMLPPALQRQFNYDPQKEAEYEEAMRRRRPVSRTAPSPQPAPRVSAPGAPVLRPKVDLRAELFRLGLYSENQGLRPSCTVFAVLGAIEYHYSIHAGDALRLSEEYLTWAAVQVKPAQEDLNGFSFGDVVEAIRVHGLARTELMPNTVGIPIRQLQPSPGAVADAATRDDVMVRAVFGTREAKVEAIIHELNEGWPVAISLRWPEPQTLGKSHTIRKQRPAESGGHAVTVVGYETAGSVEDTLFIFRNSYGPRWGMGGYGLIAYSYLMEHLNDVLLFRVRD